MFILNDSNPCQILITPTVTIPEREAWLYKNVKALERVRKGLEQARRRRFSELPPDVAADAVVADAIDS